ncbi:putative calcineurin-like phosphoesterase [Hypoxylon crocopeplum]|nr:putative calcineurin-like phosphoesterase [Hypoxylon crocopeplum]
MASFLGSFWERLHPQQKPRVQIMSDLHLEIGQQYSSYTFPVSAPFLLLGGDIGRLIDYDNYLIFLNAQVSRYDKVFLVLGNHEFYGMEYEAGLDKAHLLSEEPSLAGKLVLLHKTRWDDRVSNLTVLGCTLWSAIPEEACDIIQSTVNDFKQIRDWTAAKHNQVHDEETAWLRGQVAQVASQEGFDQRRLLVATHHAPCVKGTSRPEHDNSPWAPAFSTDLLDQAGWNYVKTWAFGHTHYSTKFARNGIKLVANQRGYFFPDSKVQIDKSTTKGGKNARDFDSAMNVTI